MTFQSWGKRAANSAIMASWMKGIHILQGKFYTYIDNDLNYKAQIIN